MNTQNSNRLAEATSPYLLQHAHNPVDWWPWCDEALALAEREDRPILLSIGYSACHWCHVMAHESFEDEGTAALMNEHFVNIKVDREERPDLDRIHQTAHQLMTQRAGGWPLTVFLDPKTRLPFFAGTYFPDQPRYGMPSFRQLLEAIARAYREKADEVRETGQALHDALRDLAGGETNGSWVADERPLSRAREYLAQAFDARDGGFGGAPKFPHPTNLEFLLDHWAHDPQDRQALNMALFSLQRMALGGINDQLGGGFARYSVDERWMIPHFEKMLYDNGQLLSLYADAWLAADNDLFAETCEGIAGWVMREMQAEEGGYYSSLDADSEGEEGLFYVWDRKRIRELLDDEQYTLLSAHYGLNETPNFEGRWHLHAEHSLEDTAAALHMRPDRARELLADARAILLAERDQRIRPARDDKILTSWNALMIRGMAHAGRLLERSEWIASAERALDFVRDTLWLDGRLLATCKDGRAHLSAYLDDHAFLLDALLELLQCRWRRADWDFAIELAERLLDAFADPQQGGFYFTADDHEALIQRPRNFEDDALPSGNAIAARALQRLGHLCGEPRYLQAAEATLQAAGGRLEHSPQHYSGLLRALREQLHPGAQLILRGPAAPLDEWQRALARSQPSPYLLPLPDGAADLPGALCGYLPAGQGVAAYLCVGTSCEPPANDLDTLLARLESV